MLSACAAPPELAYPTGQGKRALNSPGVQSLAAETSEEASVPVVPAHDAQDIQRLSEALTQLQLQLNQVPVGGRTQTEATLPSPSRWSLSGRPLPQHTSRAAASVKAPLAKTEIASGPLGGNQAVDPARNFTQGESPTAGLTKVDLAPIKGVIQVNPPTQNPVFSLEPGDTTLLGVLWRWSREMGWHMRLNGVRVDGRRFPAHPVAYADVGLERALDRVLQGRALEPALAALLQAHGAYQNQLDITLVLQSEKAEMSVQSFKKSPPATVPVDDPKQASQATAYGTSAH